MRGTVDLVAPIQAIVSDTRAVMRASQERRAALPPELAAAATADTTNSNSTAEGDPGGGEDDTISLPDKVFPFIEFNTHPPQFEERPRDQRVMSDRVASFTCRATGSPEPKIQWRKNNRRINGNSRLIVVQVPGGSILRIEPVKYQRDEAVYECVVENAAGDTIKASAKLEVLSDDRKHSTFTFGRV
ncbi:Tyrosine-protein phosphatase Lar [Portunus trituberculatus]|uniref:Tyrosine-protein phosphatase Lar n=1 Tax=Portunus trituberculatus TaxID=210409 RepID=A0A5B7FL68_PORTR|nr:Tyrosine-protein phosphatase Lar [Portunus trituberculatus]